MKLKFKANFKEIQTMCGSLRAISIKFCSNLYSSKTRRKLISRERFPNIIFNSLKPFSNIVFFKISSDKTLLFKKKGNFNLISCEPFLFISSNPIDFRFYSKPSFNNSKIVQVVNFSIFVPEKKLQELILEQKALKNKYEILKNDLLTFQKNVSANEEKTRRFVKRQFLTRLIPALDSLERAKNFSFYRIKSKKVKRFGESFCKNLQIIFNSFIQATGLEIITPSNGDLFNERYHTIVELVYKNNEKNNSILEVLKSGYSLNDEVLSPVQVIVLTNNPHHPNLSSKDKNK